MAEEVCKLCKRLYLIQSACLMSCVPTNQGGKYFVKYNKENFFLKCGLPKPEVEICILNREMLKLAKWEGLFWLEHVYMYINDPTGKLQARIRIAM